MAQIPVYIFQEVIERYKQVIVFEEFCNDLISAQEQIEIFPTSRTWDGGIDGIGASKDGNVVVLSTTTNKDIIDKFIDDATAIVKLLRSPVQAFLCTTQPVSNASLMKAQQEVTDVLPKGSTVIAYGAQQLARLCSRFSQVPGKYIANEVAELLDSIKYGVMSEDDGHPALGLALAVFGSKDSLELRSRIYRQLILKTLRDCGDSTSSSLSGNISKLLKLPRNIIPSILDDYINALRSDEMLKEIKDGVFSITLTGKEYLEKTDQASVGHYFFGKDQFKDKIEILSGLNLSDEMFQKAWGDFQSQIVEWFFSRGQVLARSVISILNNRSDEADETDIDAFNRFLDGIAKSFAGRFTEHHRPEVLEQSVKDLFSNPETNAAKWLADICSAFLVACSLGLERETSQELKALIGKMELSFDSDVLISFLCQSEGNHEGVKVLYNRSLSYNAILSVSEVVAQEVAYNAYIANIDFKHSQRYLGRSEEERQEKIDNPFVKDFACIRDKKKKLPWSRYIAQFVGDTGYDGTNVLRVMREDYHFNKLPDPEERVISIQKRVFCIMEKNIRRKGLFQDDERKELDKAKRDSILYAALVQRNNELREEGEGKSCYLVSSARRMVIELEKEVKAIKEQHPVIGLKSMLYMLSLIPDVSISRSSLRAMLFESRKLYGSDWLTRDIERIIDESNVYSLPHARRSGLSRELRDKIISDGAERGLSKAQAEKEFKNGIESGNQESARLVAEVIDGYALNKSHQEEIDRKNEEIRRLEIEVQKLSVSKSLAPRNSRKQGVGGKKR